ncbi:MAG TPA: aspartate aminotransferase family protein [Coriobacteriia bacterium]|jgi:predicted acetylornithine/succinylornithine family transaminase
MGDVLSKTQELDAAFHMPTYARKPVMFVRGNGMRLYDDSGKEYLDFVSGIGAVNLGHAHPAVAKAVTEQMNKLVQVSNLYYVEHRDELAEVLVGLLGGKRKVFFANSGAEANEGAIKLARKWGKSHRGDERVGIVTAARSFHGRTLATLAATGQPSKQEAFEPLPPGFTHVPLNDLRAMDAAVGEKTCAVMLEPIQGEGGVYPCMPGYLAEVQRLCRERDVLLILDEVQTGFFRTGAAFAHQREEYRADPDIVTCAKAMANGLPIGAVVAKAEVAEAFVPGDHGSTFAGGPVLCAAALATIGALIGEDLGGNAERAGEYLKTQLNAMAADTQQIDEIRGSGLMLAAQFGEPRAQEVAAAALDKGLVLNAIGPHILRFLPPLVCGKAEVDALLDALHAILTEAATC